MDHPEKTIHSGLPVGFRVDGTHVIAEVIGDHSKFAIGHGAESALHRLNSKYNVCPKMDEPSKARLR